MASNSNRIGGTFAEDNKKLAVFQVAQDLAKTESQTQLIFAV